MKKIIVVLLMIVIAVIGYISLQKEVYNDIVLTEKQQKILIEVLNVNGHINKKLHDEFWKNIKKEDEEKMKDIDSFTPEANKLQYLVYTDMNTSLHLKKVYISKELKEAMIVLKKRDYTNSYNNIIAVINAAATGKKVDIRGSSVNITEEMINDTLNGLDASMERAKLLLDKTWKY
jgi:hypothetical protein